MKKKHAVRPWMVVAGIVVLIAAHGLMLHYAASHAALSATALAGVIVLVVLKHLGWLGALYAVIRRHFQPDA